MRKKQIPWRVARMGLGEGNAKDRIYLQILDNPSFNTSLIGEVPENDPFILLEFMAKHPRGSCKIVAELQDVSSSSVGSSSTTAETDSGVSSGVSSFATPRTSGGSGRSSMSNGSTSTWKPSPSIGTSSPNYVIAWTSVHPAPVSDEGLGLSDYNEGYDGMEHDTLDVVLDKKEAQDKKGSKFKGRAYSRKIVSGVGNEPVQESGSKTKLPKKTKDPNKTKAPKKDPEKTKVPERTKAPKKTKDPEKTKVPKRTKDPAKTKVPERTKASKKTKDPAKTKVPERTKPPKKTKDPEKTKVPEKTKAPKKGKAPMKTKDPNKTITKDQKQLRIKIMKGSMDSVSWPISDAPLTKPKSEKRRKALLNIVGSTTLPVVQVKSEEDYSEKCLFPAYLELIPTSSTDLPIVQSEEDYYSEKCRFLDQVGLFPSKAMEFGV